MKARELGERRDYTLIPFTKLKIRDGLNIRHNLGDIETLAADIAANGILENFTVLVDGPDVIVINGHRRHAAITHNITLGIDPPLIPCFVRQSKTYSDEQQLIEMFSRNTGKPLEPIEEAEGFRRLSRDYGWTENAIARQIGKSQSYVAQRLSLLHAPKLVQETLSSGRTTTQAVQEILKAATSTKDQLTLLSDAETIAKTETGSDAPKITAAHVRAAQSAKGAPTTTPARSLKSFRAWLEEHSLLLAASPKYQTLATLSHCLETGDFSALASDLSLFDEAETSEL